MNTPQYIAIAAIVAAYLLWLGWGWVSENVSGNLFAWLFSREKKPPSAQEAIAAAKVLANWHKANSQPAQAEAMIDVASEIFRGTLK